ncbi:MAG TPA: PH domain-containing protein [Methanothrix sp.]|nr:PH domain-containing protein [Methanothrix sp.]
MIGGRACLSDPPHQARSRSRHRNQLNNRNRRVIYPISLKNGVVSPKLLNGEELMRALRPHPLAFYRLYAIWIYLALVGVYFASGPRILILDMSPETSARVLWWLSILVPAVLIALFRINWRWLFALAIPGLLAFSLPGQPEYIAFAENFGLGWFLDQNHILTAFGVLGVLGTESHRRSHRYYITNWRLIMESGHLGVHRRTLLYRNINDLVVEQSCAGKIFNFGTIIPITASGLGLGDDFSMAGAALGTRAMIAAGGGKTVSTPRGRSHHLLEGIGRPEQVHDLIVSLMHAQR